MLTIYGASYCGWCVKAKQLAETYDIPYVYFECDAVPGKRDELKARLSHVEKLTVPQIWWNEEYIGGHDDFKMKTDFDLAKFKPGY